MYLDYTPTTTMGVILNILFYLMDPMKMSRPELQESCDREGHHQEGAAYDGGGMSGHQLAPPDRWELRGDR